MATRASVHTVFGVPPGRAAGWSTPREEYVRPAGVAQREEWIWPPYNQLPVLSSWRPRKRAELQIWSDCLLRVCWSRSGTRFAALDRRCARVTVHELRRPGGLHGALESWSSSTCCMMRGRRSTRQLPEATWSRLVCCWTMARTPTQNARSASWPMFKYGSVGRLPEATVVAAWLPHLVTRLGCFRVLICWQLARPEWRCGDGRMHCEREWLRGRGMGRGLSNAQLLVAAWSWFV